MAGTAFMSSSRDITPSNPLLVASVYISEGRSEDVLGKLQATLRQARNVALLHTFVDSAYNRTGYTLASLHPGSLEDACVGVAEAAIAAVDLRQHEATHPRLGVADHISVQPIWGQQASGQGHSRWEEHAAAAAGDDAAAAPSTQPGSDAPQPPGAAPETRQAALGAAAACARGIGRKLARSCPVYYYGVAHAHGRSLADVRRQLGYFHPDKSQAGAAMWAGALGMGASLAHFPPDEGAPHAAPRTGVATVGAVAFILNYNVPLHTDDIKFARSVARSVSERGGGLPFVEAMALNHDDGCIEVACNLLEPDTVTPEAVQHHLQDACAAAGVHVGQGYTTGKTAAQLSAEAVAQLQAQEQASVVSAEG